MPGVNSNVSYCYSCKDRHDSPRGRNCAKQLAKMGLGNTVRTPKPPQDNGQSDIMKMLQSIKGDFDSMKGDVQEVRGRLDNIEQSSNRKRARSRSGSLPDHRNPI